MDRYTAEKLNAITLESYFKIHDAVDIVRNGCPEGDERKEYIRGARAGSGLSLHGRPKADIPGVPRSQARQHRVSNARDQNRNLQVTFPISVTKWEPRPHERPIRRLTRRRRSCANRKATALRASPPKPPLQLRFAAWRGGAGKTSTLFPPYRVGAPIRRQTRAFAYLSTPVFVQECRIPHGHGQCSG